MNYKELSKYATAKQLRNPETIKTPSLSVEDKAKLAEELVYLSVRCMVFMAIRSDIAKRDPEMIPLDLAQEANLKTSKQLLQILDKFDFGLKKTVNPYQLRLVDLKSGRVSKVEVESAELDKLRTITSWLPEEL